MTPVLPDEIEPAGKYSAIQVAQLFDVHRNTVYNWMKQGILHSNEFNWHKHGHKGLFIRGGALIRLFREDLIKQ